MDPVIIPVCIDGHILHAEVPVKPEARIHGLMHRPSLGQNSGMLFVYKIPKHLTFWMKNTLIPLSVAFIGETHRIVHLEDMAPHTTTKHRSPSAVRYALEANHGWFKERGIRINSNVQFTLPPSKW